MLNPDKQPEWQTFLEQRRQAEECPIGCWIRDPKEKTSVHVKIISHANKTNHAEMPF